MKMEVKDECHAQDECHTTPPPRAKNAACACGGSRNQATQAVGEGSSPTPSPSPNDYIGRGEWRRR